MKKTIPKNVKADTKARKIPSPLAAKTVKSDHSRPPIKPRAKLNLRTLADLAADPENPRKISKEALAGLQASMDKFGDLSGITFNVRTKHVVAGHQRLDGMRKKYGDLPIREEGDRAWIELPGGKRFYLRLVDWDQDTERAANITANNTAIAGTFTDALQDQLESIQAHDAELFSSLRLDELVKSNAGEEPRDGQDNTPTLRAKAKARTGDVYLLGDHRLMCGDSTKAEDVDKLMAGERAALVFTDPPYGVDYESQAEDESKRRIIGDEKTGDELIKKILLPAMRQMSRVAEDSAAFYIWHASSTRDEFAYAMKAAGLVERQYIIWAKHSFVMGHSDYHWAHEPAFYAAKDGHSPLFYGDRTQQTVWTAALSRSENGTGEMAIHLGTGLLLLDGQGGQLFIQGKAPKGKKVRKLHLSPGQNLTMAHEGAMQTLWYVSKDAKIQHPNQKPVELSVRAIENSTQPGQAVLDLFAGSGSTLMGCEQSRRRCYTMEMDAMHVDQIVSRWETATGRKARMG